MDVAVLQPSLPVPPHKEQESKRPQITVTVADGQNPSFAPPTHHTDMRFMSREQMAFHSHQQRQQQAAQVQAAQQQIQVGF